MRTYLRGKVTLLFMTLGVLLAFAGVALADQINADGDIVAPNNQTTVDLGDVDTGQTLSPQVSFLLNCNGQQHANPGGTISLNFNSGASSAAVTSATDASISVPSTWPTDTNGCGSVANVNDNGNSQVTITAPKAPGAASATVTYDVVAPTDANGSTGIVGNTTRSVTYNMNVRNLPPSISSIDGEGAVTEGDQETYTIKASDPNETSLSYSVIVVSGGATGVSGGNTLGPTVKFNSPGDVVLRATVSDGVNTAVTLERTITVASACTNPANPVFTNTPAASGWFNASTDIPTPNATTTTSGATVKYSLTENGTYSAAPALGQGETRVYAKAFSATGTCSSAAVSYLFKVDTIAP